MASVLLPVRIDLAGGWSDQLTWPFPAAVVNVSVGWTGGFDEGYPLHVYHYNIERDGKGITHDSVVRGVGTGLGISSILHAGAYILNHGLNDGYITYVLAKEQEEGTCGGWQDQIGAVAPGLKLIQSEDHHEFIVSVHPDPLIMDHIVLFDTGERRRAQSIGDRVRELFGSDDFVKVLKQNVSDAKGYFWSDPVTFGLACAEGWQRLCRLVPGMDWVPPYSSHVIGHKGVGSGGGGYAIAFVDSPDNRDAVIEDYRAAELWASKPILLPGAKLT